MTRQSAGLPRLRPGPSTSPSRARPAATPSSNLEPYAGKKYLMFVEGLRFEGETDSEGTVKQDIPKDAKQAVIKLWTGEYPTGPRQVYTLSFGEVPDASTPKGALYRLKHLGYFDGEPSDQVDEAVQAAVRGFQQDHAESHAWGPGRPMGR